MVLQFEEAGRHKWNIPIMASIALHLVVLALTLRSGPEAVFVKPSSVAKGNGPKSYRLVYFSPIGADEGVPAERKQVALQTPKPAMHKQAPKTRERKSESQEGEISDRSVKAGTAFGSLLYGPASGHDVRPAYPVVFPDPPVKNSDLPADVAGEVIVEVTIDAQGQVVETKLLEKIGHGIDEKVLATLQNWRFHPAMMDGRPIPSKHDVRFRYPS
jgi:protein TonB